MSESLETIVDTHKRRSFGEGGGKQGCGGRACVDSTSLKKARKERCRGAGGLGCALIETSRKANLTSLKERPNKRERQGKGGGVGWLAQARRNLVRKPESAHP